MRRKTAIALMLLAAAAAGVNPTTGVRDDAVFPPEAE